MYLPTLDGKTVFVLSTYDSVSNKRGSSFFLTRPKGGYGRQGLEWDHWAGTFWGFLNVSLCAFGAQLGLDIPCKFGF